VFEVATASLGTGIEIASKWDLALGQLIIFISSSNLKLVVKVYLMALRPSYLYSGRLTSSSSAISMTSWP
jgi:hypothetical protein